MVPAVPFAVLGVSALLAAAAWTALAACAVALRGLRPPALLAAAGCLLLSGVEVVTALRFGQDASDRLVLLRGAGALLLLAGLALGALGPRAAVPVQGVSGVVVPLAAGARSAVLAGVAALAVALAALRGRRDGPGVVLAVGLALSATAVLASPVADDGPDGALLVLGLRAAGAVVVLAGLALLAQTSLLAKVVATTLAGVLAMAAAAVGVVGTVVAQSYDRQAAQVVQQSGQAGGQALADLPTDYLLPARQLVQACGTGSADCGTFLDQATQGVPAVLVRVPRQGGPRAVVASEGVRLADVELRGLTALPVVQDLFAGRARAATSALARLSVAADGRGRLAAVAAVPARATAEADVDTVVLLVVPVDDELLQRTVGAEGLGLALLSALPPHPVLLADDQTDRAALSTRLRGVFGDLGRDGLTQDATGDAPTVRFVPVRDGRGTVLGVLAVTRSAAAALRSERGALTALLVSALGTTALVAVVALLLGRRTVDPVRRLTAAASRLAAGDLQGAGTGVRSRDEVGVLSRTFDTMTGALARLTGDLRSSAARLETVLASMSDGLLATDADGTVTAVNRAALEMLGAASADDVVGQPLARVADVRGADGTPLADAGLRVQDAPGEVHRADGTTVPVTVAVTGLRDGDGAVVVLRDTTREREVERMKTEFLSNVSHELRTPLTPIRGYADILVSRPGLDADKVARFAGTILAESLKMNRVVDLLVDVASLEAGRVVPRPVEVDVRTLLDARLDAWRGKAPERAADLRRRVAAGLPPVLVDPEWVGKALDELVDNALKYSAPGTPVTLVGTPAPDGSRVRLAVRDAGPGIAEADQALLFTSFEQVDGSATRRVGGLGLGLSFVRRVADDAGFPLTVTSEVGRGSEFALDVPPGTAPAPRQRRVSPGSRAARR